MKIEQLIVDKLYQVETISYLHFSRFIGLKVGVCLFAVLDRDLDETGELLDFGVDEIEHLQISELDLRESA
jgi:hypothetical protein